jgi:hypothetical protein
VPDGRAQLAQGHLRFFDHGGGMVDPFDGVTGLKRGVKENRRKGRQSQNDQSAKEGNAGESDANISRFNKTLLEDG